MIRIAVVLMNLGGPDRLEAVQPFLFNLFSDPAILRLPALFRLPLARIVAWRRAPIDWFVADSSLEETRH